MVLSIPYISDLVPLGVEEAVAAAAVVVVVVDNVICLSYHIVPLRFISYYFTSLHLTLVLGLKNIAAFSVFCLFFVYFYLRII